MPARRCSRRAVRPFPPLEPRLGGRFFYLRSTPPKTSAVFCPALRGEKTFRPRTKIFFSAEVPVAAPQCFFRGFSSAWLRALWAGCGSTSAARATCLRPRSRRSVPCARPKASGCGGARAIGGRGGEGARFRRANSYQQGVEKFCGKFFGELWGIVGNFVLLQKVQVLTS